jgi:very-short-patch-repair endonuclease
MSDARADRRAFTLVNDPTAEGTERARGPSMVGMSIDALLVHQAGIVSREQALAAGMTTHAVDHRVRTRRWRPVHPRVYLASGHRLGDEARVRAALLWAGADAVLSGTAAAWWHGLVPDAPAVVGVTVPGRRRPRRHRGVQVRRRDLAAADGTVVRGLAVTARPLAVLEAAVEMGAQGGPFLDRALQGAVTFPAVYAAYCSSLGAHGSATARLLLVAAADRSASVAGRRLVRLLREAGVSGWRCGIVDAGHVLDLAFPAHRVVVGVDGWAWHLDATRVEADEQLVRRGWTVLRYTWHDLVGRPDCVIAEIRYSVDRAGSRSA